MTAKRLELSSVLHNYRVDENAARAVRHVLVTCYRARKTASLGLDESARPLTSEMSAERELAQSTKSQAGVCRSDVLLQVDETLTGTAIRRTSMRDSTHRPILHRAASVWRCGANTLYSRTESPKARGWTCRGSVDIARER